MFNAPSSRAKRPEPRRARLARFGPQRSSILATLLLAAGLTLAGARHGLAQASDEAPESTRGLLKLNLEDLVEMKVNTVYGASKYEQPVTDAPASVTIITSDEIRRYGYRTLADILAGVPGVYLTSDRNYTYVGIRGMGRSGGYNNRVLVLVDGHRLNDNVYDQALIGNGFPVDVDLIERVEVIRGPGSSIYGSNALLGVINVITRKNQPAAGFETSGSVAGSGTGEGRVTYSNGVRDGLKLMFSTSFYASHGPGRLYFKEFDSPDTDYGIARNVDGSAFQQAFAAVSFHDFSLEGVYGNKAQQIPTGSYGTVFNDPHNKTTDSRGYVDLRYHHTFSGRWEFTGSLAYDQADYQGVYAYAGSPALPIVLNIDEGHGKWLSADAQATRTLYGRHKVTFGSEFRRNYELAQTNYDQSPFQQYLDDRRHSTIFGLYAQDELTLRKNLILDAGLRFDRYGTFGGATDPRLALIYSPLKKTTLKFLYGRAFRAPNAYELYYAAFPNIANPGLRPETVQNFEIAAEQGLGQHLSISGDVFQNRAHNLIGDQMNADGAIQYQNFSSVVTRGMEAEVDGKWPSGIDARFSYTFEAAHDLATGSPLVDSPRHMAKLNLSVPVLKRKAFAGLDVIYFSSRRTLAGNETGGFVLPNLTLFSAPVGRRWNLSASLYNLFGTRYGYPGGEENRQDILYQDGRTFRFKLSYTFGGSGGGR